MDQENLNKGYVYFIITKEQIVDINCLIKIGYTNNVDKRFKAIQANSPIELLLFAEAEFYSPHLAFLVEQALHTRFKTSRHRNEWFLFDYKIKRYLNKEAHLLGEFKKYWSLNEMV